MAFPTHAHHPALGSTPSSGKAEVRDALRRINARPGRNKLASVQEVRRKVRLRDAVLTDATVKTVLDALVSDGDAATSSSKYRLTTAGLSKLRVGQRPRPIGAFRSQ